MSSLVMTATEEKGINAKIEGMLDWASTRQHEAEQLAMDASRLLSCSSDRLDRIKKQGFFTRCWSRFSGGAAEAERANTGDLIQMQKISLRYINVLQEQQLMMAHSMLTLKNNLLSLVVKEEETRNLIGMLAQRTLERFEKLESRVDQLEVSTNLQGWLLGLEEREYDEKYPTEYMRLFRIINDFYTIKDDLWSYNDLIFMRVAMRKVKIDPRKRISMNQFINDLTDEIQSEYVGFPMYKEAITLFQPKGMPNYSSFVVENVSSQVFTAIHDLKIQYVDRLDVVKALIENINISESEALKHLLRRSIEQLNVRLDYEFPLAETAIEILGCLRLAQKLALPADTASPDEPKTGKRSLAEEVRTQKNSPEKENLSLRMKQAEAAARKTESTGIDVRNLTMSGWKSKGLLFPTGNMLLTQLSRNKSAVRKVASHWVFLSEKGTFATLDFFTIKQVCDISFSSGSILYPLYFAGGKAFIFKDNTWAWSQNCITWEKFTLPEKYAEERILYRDVFFHNGRWHFWGTRSIKYSAVKKQFIGSKTVKNAYQSAVMYSCTDFSSLRAYSFTQDFDMHEIHDICYGDGKFVATMTHVKDNDVNYIACSSDGKTWQYSESEDCFYDIIYFNNKFYGSSKGDIHEIFPDTGKHSKINSDLKNISVRRDSFKVFPEHNLAIYKGYNDSSLYLSNDLMFWEKIEIPCESNIESFGYDGSQLVYLTPKNEIMVRDLK